MGSPRDDDDDDGYLSPAEYDARHHARAARLGRSKSVRPNRGPRSKRSSGSDVTKSRSSDSDRRLRSKSEPRRRFEDFADKDIPTASRARAGESALVGMTVETADKSDNSAFSSVLSGPPERLWDPVSARRQQVAMRKVEEEANNGTIATHTTESRTPVHTILEERCEDDDMRDCEIPVNFGGSRQNDTVIPAITRGVQMALSENNSSGKRTSHSDVEGSSANSSNLSSREERSSQSKSYSSEERGGVAQFALDLNASTRVSRQGETPLRLREPLTGQPISQRLSRSRDMSTSGIESASDLTPHGKKLQRFKRSFSVGAAARRERGDLFAQPFQEKHKPRPDVEDRLTRKTGDIIMAGVHHPGRRLQLGDPGLRQRSEVEQPKDIKHRQCPPVDFINKNNPMQFLSQRQDATRRNEQKREASNGQPLSMTQPDPYAEQPHLGARTREYSSPIRSLQTREVSPGQHSSPMRSSQPREHNIATTPMWAVQSREATPRQPTSPMRSSQARNDMTREHSTSMWSVQSPSQIVSNSGEIKRTSSPLKAIQSREILPRDSPSNLRQTQPHAIVPKTTLPREIFDSTAMQDTVSHLSSMMGTSMISFSGARQPAKSHTKATSHATSSSIRRSTVNNIQKEETVSEEVNKVVETLVGQDKKVSESSSRSATTTSDNPSSMAKMQGTEPSRGYGSYLLGWIGMNKAQPKQDPDVLSKTTKTSSEQQAIETLSNRLQEAEKQTERLKKEVTVLKEALDDTASTVQLSWWPFGATFDHDKTGSDPPTKAPSSNSERSASSSDSNGRTTSIWGACNVFEPIMRLIHPPRKQEKEKSSMLPVTLFASKGDHVEEHDIRKLQEENIKLRKEMKRICKTKRYEDSEDNSGSMSSSISSYTESVLTKNTSLTKSSNILDTTTIVSQGSYGATEITYGPRISGVVEQDHNMALPVVEESSRHSKHSRKASGSSARGSRSSRVSVSRVSRYSGQVSKSSSRGASKSSSRVSVAQKSGSSRGQLSSRSSRISSHPVSTSSQLSDTRSRTSRISEVESKYSRISDLPSGECTLAQGQERQQHQRQQVPAYHTPLQHLPPSLPKVTITDKCTTQQTGNDLDITIRSATSARSNNAASVASSTRSQPALLARPVTPRVPTALLDEARRLRAGRTPSTASSSSNISSFRDKIHALKYKAINDGMLREGGGARGIGSGGVE